MNGVELVHASSFVIFSQSPNYIYRLLRIQKTGFMSSYNHAVIYIHNSNIERLFLVDTVYEIYRVLVPLGDSQETSKIVSDINYMEELNGKLGFPFNNKVR